MARFSWQERNWPLLTINCIASVAVFFTLAINLSRGYPLGSFGALLLIAVLLYRLWVKAGRPEGVTDLEKDVA
jgi:hypothetical protein